MLALVGHACLLHQKLSAMSELPVCGTFQSHDCAEGMAVCSRRDQREAFGPSLQALRSSGIRFLLTFSTHSRLAGSFPVTPRGYTVNPSDPDPDDPGELQVLSWDIPSPLHPVSEHPNGSDGHVELQTVPSGSKLGGKGSSKDPPGGKIAAGGIRRSDTAYDSMDTWVPFRILYAALCSVWRAACSSLHDALSSQPSKCSTQVPAVALG